MKRVLFYYPSNKSSVALETIIYSLQKEGIKFSLLTTCKKGKFHEELEKKGIKTYTNNIKTIKAGIIMIAKFPTAMAIGDTFCKCLLIIFILKAYITVAIITKKAYQ